MFTSLSLQNMLGGEACYNELDPSSNPVLFLEDEDYTLKLQSDTLHNESLFEILDTASNNGGEGGNVTMQ